MARSTAHRYVSSLRFPENRVFWYGTSLSSVSQGAFLVSASWLAYRLGGSGAVGITTFATMGPFLFATPIGGVLADRYDRRDVVLATQVVQAIVALVLGLQAMFATVPFIELALLVLVSGIARAVELPTVAAVLPNLVPEDELLNTFSLNSLATLGSRFTGPVVVAPLLATGGASTAFLVIAAIYLPALRLTARVRPMRQQVAVLVSPFSQLREGGRYLLRHATLGLIFAITILHCGLTMSFDSTLPLFAEENLGGSGGVYSAMVASVGLGAIAGTFALAGLRSQALRGPLLLAGVIGSGLSTVLMAVAGWWPLAIASLFACGATQALFMTLVTTLVQESVPDALRGRANSIVLMGAGGIMSFTNLANGYLADRFGVLPVLALPAAAFLAALLAISLARPALRRLYQEGRLPVEQAATAGD